MHKLFYNREIKLILFKLFFLHSKDLECFIFYLIELIIIVDYRNLEIAFSKNFRKKLKVFKFIFFLIT